MIALEISGLYELRSGLASKVSSLDLGVSHSAARSPRDTNLIIIPASTFKGQLRFMVERILRSSGVTICQPPKAENMCQDLTNLCLACQVFGNPRYASPTRFEDIEFPQLTSVIRGSVSIKRKTRTSSAQKLFFHEVGTKQDANTPTGQFKIQAIALSREQALIIASTIYLGLKMITKIGGSKSRGLGTVQLKESHCQLTTDDQPPEILTPEFLVTQLGTMISQTVTGGQ